ncbi:MAG: KpsF/GutQ family sugar-phosphate isomerase [Candidatus Firestonebacteria bacterium]
MIANNILKQAKKVLRTEASAILALESRIDKVFLKAIELLYSCNGRVIVTGIGKSGIIGRKIAATLASTGTPALFLHPAEGLHGDLGMIRKNDIVMVLSNSGETEEVIKMLPSIKRIGAKLITLTGDLKSTLAKQSDVTINVKVKDEACPLGLAPTASTTATLAMGDAMAIALLEKRNFKSEDYALFHPGGSLGRKLILKVEDIMRKGEDVPKITQDKLMKDAILEMTSKKMGCTAVIDKKGKLLGIITDQDLRKNLGKDSDILNVSVKDIMTKNPKTISKDELVAKAIQVTEEISVSTLLVADKSGKLIGIVHLHDLLKAVG